MQKILVAISLEFLQKYKNEQTNKANYFGTDHEKMLHNIDMRFTEQIRTDIFERTLEDWSNFVKKFTYPSTEK